MTLYKGPGRIRLSAASRTRSRSTCTQCSGLSSMGPVTWQNWLSSRPFSVAALNSSVPSEESASLARRLGRAASRTWKGPEMAMSWNAGMDVRR